MAALSVSQWSMDRARAGTGARCWRRSGRSCGRSTRTRRTRPCRPRCGPRPAAPSGAARPRPSAPAGRSRRPGPEARPGPDPRRGRRQLLAARGDPLGREDARVAPEFLGRFPRTTSGGYRGRRSRNRPAPAAASPANIGSSLTSPVRSARPLRHRRQPEGDRRADASECTD